MITKFKVGNKIELINNSSMAALKGATAIIKKINRDYINIVWDSNNFRHGQSNGNYDPEDFKLAYKTWKERYDKP